MLQPVNKISSPIKPLLKVVIWGGGIRLGGCKLLIHELIKTSLMP